MRGHVVMYTIIGAVVVYLFYFSSGARQTCSFFDWITAKCGA